MALLAYSAGCGGSSTAKPNEESKSSGLPLERVLAGKPKVKTLRLETTQPARIVAFEETPLYSKLAGYVDQVLVDIGDRVTKDQVLVRLWVPELVEDYKQKEAVARQAAAAIEQAKASSRAAEAAVATRVSQVHEANAGVERAVADLTHAQAELNRISELAASDSVTQRLVDEARSQYQAATANRALAAAQVKTAEAELAHTEAMTEKSRADVSAAEAQLQVARVEVEKSQILLQYAEIKAPYNGIVTARNVDTRHFVQPAAGAGKPLVVVASNDRVRVFVDVPELEAALLDRGDPAVVRVQALGKREFGHEITRDAWSLDETNRCLRAEIDLPNPDGVLRPGMYAAVTIRLAEAPDALVLPAAAVLRDAAGPYCMAVDGAVVKKRTLELGLRSGPEVAILSGVSVDDLVVLMRGDSLADGQAVEVLPAK
jgi:RND family efflux transporter MFP subunit